MKKVMIIFIILILLTVTGCANKDVIKHHYVFKGENDYWTVVYEVNTKATFYKNDGRLHCDIKSNNEFTATYKKELSDFSSKKNIEIGYKSITGEAKLSNEIDHTNPQRTYSMKSSSTGGALEKADDVIEVTINMDGNIQTIELRNE